MAESSPDVESPASLHSQPAGKVTLLSEADVHALPGASLEAKLTSVTTAHGVLVFSKPGCPFCLEVKRTFTLLAVPYTVVEVTDAEFKKALRTVSNHATFPNVYIAGTQIGGCDTIKTLQANNKLEPLLQDLSVAAPRVLGATNLQTIKLAPQTRGQASQPLLWFPNVVNRWVIQGTGILVVSLCILCIIYREHRWGKWLTAFLLFDFASRFAFGGAMSMLSQLAALAVAPFENGRMRPMFKAAPPKQLAAVCGVSFSVVATACYFTGNTIPGAVILGLLSGAAGLEGFLDFCFGCVIFGFLVKYRIVPDYVYCIATNTMEETKTSWEYANLPSGAAEPKRGNTQTDEPDALRYKIKSAEWTKDDFHLVRNMQVGYFGMPMGIGGLAVAFKVASSWTGMWASSAMGVPYTSTPGTVLAQSTWWYTFGILAAGIYCVMLFLYMLRAALYPRKVSKEWACPWRSNAFALIAANLFIFAFLIYDLPGNTARHLRFARVIWWIGGVANMGMTVAKIGGWVSRSLTKEHISPAWMLIPSANLLAALVAAVMPLWAPHAVHSASPLFGPGFKSIEVASFFFSIGIFMWVVLFTITFQSVATSHNTQESVRSAAYVWLTPPTVGGLAYLAINFARSADKGAVVATFALSYYLSIILFLSLAWAWLPSRQFFGQNKFDMSYWNFTFPLDALAASAAMYYQLGGFRIGLVLMIMFLVVAAVCNALCLLHTLNAVVKRRVVFTPEDKFGPLAFMKLTHEAFRGAMPQLEAAMAAMDASKPDSVRRFAALYARFELVHLEHARHEDEIIFKYFNELFPNHADTWLHDHDHDRELVVRWDAAINAALADLSAPGVAGTVTMLKHELPHFFKHFMEHMQGEEDNLNAIGRKYVNLELQKQLLARVFTTTDVAKWEVIFPFIIQHCPRHVQRTRYVQAFTWAMPERAQQIGAVLYRNVDAVMWERLRVVLPEIVPRGVAHHTKFY